VLGALALGAALGTATLAFAADASSSPLTIGNLRVSNVDGTHATVKWHTNAPADSKIEYGTTTAYGSTLADSAYVSGHALVLRDLATSTTYHFHVISKDDADRAASGDDSFTTASSRGGSGTSTVSTTITDVRAKAGATRATIKWHTDQLADSKVEYGTTTTYGMSRSDTDPTQSHAIVLTGLMPEMTYHYRVVSNNDNGTTRSQDYTFLTSSANMNLPAPTLLSPPNGITETSDEQQSASWSAVSDAAGGITYVYQAAHASTTAEDGSFTDPSYTSEPLSTTTIATPNTPEGVYWWHVQATDAQGNQSDWSAPWQFTIDNSSNAGAPVISAIGVSGVGSDGATITWQTDQPASSQVIYGTDQNYGSSTPLDSSLATSHSITLSGLMASTTYHFAVRSGNANGTTTSSDQQFSTEGGSNGGVSLALLGVDTVRGTAAADGSFADGWEWVFHFVVPQDEDQFAMSFSDFWNTSDQSQTIPAADDIRYYSTQSANATSSDSAVLITAADQYPSTMLDLTGDASSTSAGRQVDVTVDMAVPSGTAAGSYLGDWNAESTTTATSTP
jgi:hypothetical protein